MKHLKYLLYILVVLSFALAACGGAPATEAPVVEEPATEEPVVEEAATEEPMAEADAGICGTTEEVTITYVGDPVDTAKEAELATIARFNEHCPNITVNRIDGEASTTDLMASYLTVFEAEASDLDVIRVDVVYPGVLAKHLLDLKPYTPQEQLDSYIPSLLVNNTVDGQLVALPIRLGFGMLLSN